MSTEQQQAAVGYVRVETGKVSGARAQVERQKHSIIYVCLDSRLRLTHMNIDIGGRPARIPRPTPNAHYPRLRPPLRRHGRDERRVCGHSHADHHLNHLPCLVLISRPPPSDTPPS